MRNIQVIAKYETDTEPSKFDALLKQYKLAKEIADETESVKQPLIDAMGEAKLALIKEQLGIIVGKMTIMCDLRGGSASFEAHGYSDAFGFSNDRHTVSIRMSRDGRHTIYLDGYTFEHPSQYWFSEDGIVTLWNKLKLHEQLERKCEMELEHMIKSQEAKTKRIEQNYENMIKG